MDSQLYGAKNGVAVSLALGLWLSVGALLWFGYHAIDEWRNSSQLLAQRRADEAATLLLKALTADMRGVQESFLTSIVWRGVTASRAHDLSASLATVFAEYPYPESFFTWRAASDAGTDEGMLFFTRSERRPSWSSLNEAVPAFPVVTERNTPVAESILLRVTADAAAGRPLSAFNVPLGQVQYQVVAVLTYRDAFREELAQIVGFMVDLSWVREHYFADFTEQVSEVVGADLMLTVADGQGRSVAGPQAIREGTTASDRSFELAFFDSDLMLHIPDDLSRQPWALSVSAAGDLSLSRAIDGANRTMIVGAVSAMALTLGLVLALRADRRAARLASLRSDFVSTVTHELKTPIAAIRAAAETLAQGRLPRVESYQVYGGYVVTHAKRLTRLVENLLAYSRITDVAAVYAFAPLDVAELFEDIGHEFRAQLEQARFTLSFSVEPGTPLIRGDRLALRLLFDNLVDNSIRYSGGAHWIALSAKPAGRGAVIEIRDGGVGIPPEEIDSVTGRFVRGSRAPSGGSGLGLAIARRIAVDHGGTLEIQSAIGEGTSVRVTIPAAANPASVRTEIGLAG